VRVLMWSELFWPYIGGAEIFGARLMLALRDRGHDFLVVTSHDYLVLPDEAHYGGIPIHRLPFRAAFADRHPRRLGEVRRQAAALKQLFAPDLVHANGVGPSLLLHLQTMDACRSPYLLTLQQELLPSQTHGGETLLQRALRSAAWVSGCSDAALAQVRRLAPETTPRSSLIRNGIDVPAEPPEPLPVDPPRLLCLGRLVPAKGFDSALTAFAMLVVRFPTLRLMIAGDGSARQDLEQQAARLGLTATVDFLGWVDPAQVPTILNAVTIVVMPSRREGLPLVAVQAALMARPIVARRVGGLPEIVVHQETGLLVDAEDSRALAEAIAFLLEHPEAAARMGWAGRRRTRELLSWDRCIDAYDTLYRTVTGGRPC
jgi:glycogen synthase